MAKPASRNHEAVTRAEGEPYFRVVADRGGWWAVCSPAGWRQTRPEWRYGPFGGARDALRWLETLRRELAAAENGDAQGVLDRWTRERPWEQ